MRACWNKEKNCKTSSADSADPAYNETFPQKYANKNTHTRCIVFCRISSSSCSSNSSPPTAASTATATATFSSRLLLLLLGNNGLAVNFDIGIHQKSIQVQGFRKQPGPHRTAPNTQSGIRFGSLSSSFCHVCLCACVCVCTVCVCVSVTR